MQTEEHIEKVRRHMQVGEGIRTACLLGAEEVLESARKLADAQGASLTDTLLAMHISLHFNHLQQIGHDRQATLKGLMGQ